MSESEAKQVAVREPQVSISMSRELVAAVDAIAKAEQRSRSFVVRKLIEEAVAARGGK